MNKGRHYGWVPRSRVLSRKETTHEHDGEFDVHYMVF